MSNLTVPVRLVYVSLSLAVSEASRAMVSIFSVSLLFASTRALADE